ncbi:ABC-2 type transport system permease protein [Kitasatospora sp. GP30]|jgi:ABC-type transport system involved in multi-copper enzyme maturation permease subunit|nr:ABC-2 type transport system permease protein [Kitasatospora sp. GP30]
MKPVSVASVAEHPVRFRDLFASEWIKLFAQRSTYVMLGLALLISIGGSWLASGGVHLVSASARADYDRVSGSFKEGTFALLAIGAGALGALSMVGEFSSGLIRTTFIAVPDRRRIVLAKAAVLASVTSAAGLVAAVASFVTAQSILEPEQLGISFANPHVLQAFTASVLVIPISALIGMFIGALIRVPVASFFAVFVAQSLLADALPGNSGNHLLAAISDAMPRNAWFGLVSQHTAFDNDGPFPPGALQCWVALLAWPLLALLLTALVVRRRDV